MKPLLLAVALFSPLAMSATFHLNSFAYYRSTLAKPC